jgi:hypothetical protein
VQRRVESPRTPLRPVPISLVYPLSILAKPALYYLRLGPHHLLKPSSSPIISQPA